MSTKTLDSLILTTAVVLALLIIVGVWHTNF